MNVFFTGQPDAVKEIEELDLVRAICLVDGGESHVAKVPEGLELEDEERWLVGASLVWKEKHPGGDCLIGWTPRSSD